MKLASIVGKIRKQYAKVDSTGEETCAEATNGRRRDFSNVNGTAQRRIVLVVHNYLCTSKGTSGGRNGFNWDLNSPYDRRLSYAEAGDKSTGIDDAQVSLHSAGHKNSNSNSPDEAQHSRGIQPANTITNQEGTIAKMQVVIR